MWVGERIVKGIRQSIVGVYLAAQDFYYARWGRYRVVEASDIPDEGEPGLLYLVGEDGNHWIAAMRCPCGCATLLEMNLLPDAEPVWRLSLDRSATPTLSPSVWPREGCGAHFHLRGGKIRWAA